MSKLWFFVAGLAFVVASASADAEDHVGDKEVDVPVVDDRAGDEKAAGDKPAGDKVTVSTSERPKYETESIRGQVVWMGEALEEQFQISTVPESHQRTLAILTEDGCLYPLAEDLRGRSFRTDERLRNKPMELRVRRYAKQPMLQILRIYEFKDGKKFQVDYWCDVCAIVMFEHGFCACCQDTNRLRHRPVDENSASDGAQNEAALPDSEPQTALPGDK